MSERTGSSVAARRARAGARYAVTNVIIHTIRLARHDIKTCGEHGDLQGKHIADGRLIAALTIAQLLNLPIAMDPALDDVHMLEPYLACGGRKGTNI